MAKFLFSSSRAVMHIVKQASSLRHAFCGFHCSQVPLSTAEEAAMAKTEEAATTRRRMYTMLKNFRSVRSKDEKFSYIISMFNFANANSIELWKWVDIDDIYDALTPELQKSSADEIVNLIMSFNLRDPVVKRMIEVLADRKDELTLHHWVYLCNIIDQVPLLSNKPGAYFNKMKSVLLQQMNSGIKLDFKVVACAIKTLRRSTGQCQHRDLSQIAAYLARNLDNLNLEDVSFVVAEMIRFRYLDKRRNADFLSAVTHYFIKLLDSSFSLEDRADKWGRGYGYYFSSILQLYSGLSAYHKGLCDRLTQLYLGPYDREIHNPRFTQQLMIMCRMIQFYDKALFERATQEVLDNLDSFHFRELSSILWSLSYLNHEHKELVCRVADLLLETTQIRHTSWLYWSVINSCTTMNYYPSRELLERFLTDSMMEVSLELGSYSNVTLLKLLIGLAVENPHLGLAEQCPLKFGSYPYRFKTISNEHVLNSISYVITKTPKHKTFSIFGSNFCRALKIIAGKNGYISEPTTFSGLVCDFEIGIDSRNRLAHLPTIWKYIHVNRALQSIGAKEDESRRSCRVDGSTVPQLVEELKSSETNDHPCASESVSVLNQNSENQMSQTGLCRSFDQDGELHSTTSQLTSLKEDVRGKSLESQFASSSQASCSHESNLTSRPNDLDAQGSQDAGTFLEKESMNSTLELNDEFLDGIGAISCYDAKTKKSLTFSLRSNNDSALAKTAKEPLSKSFIKNAGFSVHLASDWGQYFASTGALLKRQVLFELNGPMHYAVNDQQYLLGKDVVKKRQLEAMGWEVIQMTSSVGSATPPIEDLSPNAVQGSPKRTPLPADTVAGMRVGRKRRQKAPPLGVDEVTNALESLTDWWRHVGWDVLDIPNTVLDGYESKYSNDAERLRAAIRYWLLRDPLASWRKLIYKLDDRSNDAYHVVAAEIRSYAEKQSDSTLTSGNLSAVLEGLSMENVRNVLRIPYAKWDELKEQHPDDSKFRAILVKYYLKIDPYASWMNVAGGCLYWGCDSALLAAKRWIKPDKVSTLTSSSLVGLFNNVDWDYLYWSLDIPDTVYDTMRSCDKEAKARVCCDWYLNHHPAPSWDQVAIALYDLKHHDILATLRNQVPSLRGSRGSRDMFSKYMKLGYVESCIGKMLVYGACGTGKSSFMDLMIGNPPKQIRKSTPLAARPVAVFQLDTSCKEKWTKLSKSQRKKILIKAMMKVPSLQDQAEDSASEEEDFQCEMSTTNSQPSEQHHPTEGQNANPNPSTQDTQHAEIEATPTHAAVEEKEILKSVSTCDDLVSLVQLCSASDEAVNSYRKILLIDSGGQPQFHVILPVFLRRMSLYVFVFKLSDELDGKPAVEYYDASGKPLGKPYESAHTNKQLLQHCLRTLHTHRSSSKGKRSRIMIVGSHRDIEAQCTTEKREDKEKKLLKLLLPAFKDEVVYSKSRPKRFIFPLNAKNPESQDRALVEKIQQLVTTECSPEPVKVPLHYFALELVLEEASEKLGRGILSIEECLEAAAELHFDRHTLDLALQYLDELSVVFYFPEVLEGVLFINTQVLLDKATELVQKLYQLQEDGNCDLIVGEWQTFLENACFDLQFLSRPDFSKHYLPGLFTPVELVKLFKKLLIFADFHGDQLFMPALLRVLKEEEVPEYCVSADSPAAPLALDFPHGGPRLGVFCALSCFLVSSGNQFPRPWKIKIDPNDETPICLYHNCIRFSIPDYSGSVTLIDSFSHFEVHVRSSECCSIVREAILFALKEVHTILGYLDCTPSLAFVCPCKKGIPHVATVKRGKWICKRDSDESGKADARYLVWENKTGYLGRDAPMMADLSFIKNKEGCKFQLLSQVAVHWKIIAEALGLGLDDVERIATQYKDNVDEKVRHVFMKWLENASELPRKENYPLSWHGLNELLIDSELAEIARKYFAFLDTCN